MMKEEKGRKERALQERDTFNDRMMMKRWMMETFCVCGESTKTLSLFVCADSTSKKRIRKLMPIFLKS